MLTSSLVRQHQSLSTWKNAPPLVCFSLQGIADTGIALTILTAFCFIPAGYTIYLIKERINAERQLQRICGVGTLLYWFTALLWDLVSNRRNTQTGSCCF